LSKVAFLHMHLMFRFYFLCEYRSIRL
jgi:hypothetical protein